MILVRFSSRVATFWEKAAQMVLFVFCVFVILVVYHFGFESGTVFLTAPVPGYCLPFTLQVSPIFQSYHICMHCMCIDDSIVFKLHASCYMNMCMHCTCEI